MEYQSKDKCMNSTDLIDKLRNQAVAIRYKKLNGGSAVIKATLMSEMTENKRSKTTTRDPNGEFSKPARYPEKILAVWDIDSEGWRDIRWKSITEVDGSKIHYGIKYDS
jgi:hypothetical protein